MLANDQKTSQKQMLNGARKIISKQAKIDQILLLLLKKKNISTSPFFFTGTSHFRHLVHSSMHENPTSIQAMAAT
jgi:hypothetical protein